MATIKFKNAQGQWEELSAAKLETARNINGVPFDGSQDITIPTGSSDYQGLSNKPQINGIELDGNKTLDDLSIEPKRGVDDFYLTNAEKAELHTHDNKSILDTITSIIILGWNAAATWVSTYGSSVLNHIENSTIHVTSTLLSTINNKVDKITGKGLSTNDFTDDYKNNGAIGTGNDVLPTVKNVADRVDRLLVDFTVPLDTPLITFDRDKNGILFSELDVKSLIIDYYIKIPVTVNGTMIMRINNVATSTYKQSGALTTGFFARIGIESTGKCFLNKNGGLISALVLSVLSNTDTDVNNIVATNPSQGINRTVSKIDSVQLLGNGSTFSAGSNLKIYRND